MAEDASSSKEQVVELSGQSAGQASARVVELATSLGYTVAATAPGSFRLARTGRKMLVMKRVESATVAVSEDRNGTRARIVGDVDHAFVEHLTASTTSDAQAPATQSSITPPGPCTAAPPRPPSPPLGAPAPSVPSASSVPPVARSAGLITTPSWAPQQTPGGSAPPALPPLPSPAAPRGGDVEELDDRTVARSSLGRANAEPGPPSLALPGGRIIPLTQLVVVGRSPDPTRAPGKGIPVAVADPSLSKTHASFEHDAGGFWVTDLHSTNGTTIEGVGPARACEPGVRTLLPAGAVARLGDLVVSTRGTS